MCYSGCYAKTEAQPWRAVDPQGGIKPGQWQGTWGKHYFTAANLQRRAQAYWCQWSEDWQTYDYIKFCGAVVKIPQTAPCSWMINFDQYLAVQLKDYTPKNAEDEWGHPGILLNNPKTHIIYPPSIYMRKKYYTTKIPAPAGWKGYQRLPAAETFIFFHYLWSWWDPLHAFYNYGEPGQQDKCNQNPWWGGTAYNKLPLWVDRQKYDVCSSDQSKEETWGPFLPCAYKGSPECSLFFQYKIKLKVVGNAIWRPVPRNIDTEGLAPDAPGRQSSSQTFSTHRKRPRPQDEADIWPGDLDSTGILKETAFQRIVGAHHGDKRRRLGREGRIRHIAGILKSVLQQRGLIRLRDPDPPGPPQGGDKKKTKILPVCSIP